MAAGCDNIGAPETHISYKCFAASLIIWLGALWAMVLFHLFSSAEGQAACMLLIVSPALAVLLGLPVFAQRHTLGRKADSHWRVAAGLSWVGILAGHTLSRSCTGDLIDNFVSGLNLFPKLTGTTGTTIMLLSMARIVRGQSRAAKDLHATETIPTDSVGPFEYPPQWVDLEPRFVVTWTIGLALCVSTIKNPWGRAALVSTSAAIVLTMAFLPPFSGKIWKSYEGHMQLLFMLHILALGMGIELN
ncbi:hypothetical protein Slin15195_G027150 [Septoria linicola]|uniref:Uncharacterized protein n=1 Tax=Septoria linicola TaxID=215465 RepID=A0A9Q9EF33_9PEZI|nr:hypothetical protein Slin15195_G027150 [Septoria linicola]